MKLCLPLAALLLAFAAPAFANPLEQRREAMAAYVETARENLRQAPDDPAKQMKLAEALASLGAAARLPEESLSIYREAYALCMDIYASSLNSMGLYGTDALALASVMLMHSLSLAPQDAQNFADTRDAMSKMRSLEGLEPALSPLRGMLASVMARRSKDAAEREALFAEASEALGAGKLGQDVMVRYMLAESLAWQAHFSGDKSRKDTLYAQSLRQLEEPAENAAMHVKANYVKAGVMSYFLQAQDAPIPALRDALLERGLDISKAIWGEEGATLLFSSQAEAIRGNAEACVGFLERSMAPLPESERYIPASHIRNDIFYDNVRNKPVFVKFMKSLPQ